MLRWLIFASFVTIFVINVNGFAALEEPSAASSPASQPALSADEIVRRADRIRLPENPYQLDVAIIDFFGEEAQPEKTYRTYVKNLSNALVEYRGPPSERGKSLLMLNEDVWIYLPNVGKPVRIGLRQRLTGLVAIGDVVRADYAEDYTATLVNEEPWGDKPAYVLNLEAKSPNKTYQRIRYWVAKNDFRPLFAEYFSPSGLSLKSLTFKDFRVMDGKERPALCVFQDTSQKNRVTHLRFDKMERKPLQDMMFTPQYMRNFE